MAAGMNTDLTQSDSEFDWFQEDEIRKGKEKGLDVSIYARPDIPYDIMHQLRRGLEEGVNLSPYIKCRSSEIKQIRAAMKAGVDLTPYLGKRYDAEQLEQIRLSIMQGISLDKYLDMDYRGAALAEIRKGLKAGLDVDQYISIDYDWKKMRELRLGLMHQLDITIYNNPFYSWQQMHEIRLGLLQGLDVTEYRKLRYSAEEMRRQRLSMLEEAESSVTADAIEELEYSITFSEGNMEAYLTYTGSHSALSYDVLRNILEQNGVVYGILEDGLTEIMNQTDSRDPVLVAQGSNPHLGPNGWYEYFFRTMLDKKPKVMDDGSVDYQDVDWFETVKKGQKIAVYHSAEPGVDGHTVTGEVLRAKKGIEQPVLTGSGYYQSDDKKTYFALYNGKVELLGTALTVSKYLEVSEVTLTTGNLRFDGSVRVKGEVGDGVIVDVTEDLVIDGNVGSARIMCGGTLLIKNGMNARGLGFIKSKGKVTSRFFEDVKVECDSDIQVNRCMNSQLYAKGSIFCSMVLLGGVAESVTGLQLKNAGNKNGTHTEIRIVQDQKLIDQLYKISESKKEIKSDISTLKRSLDDIQMKYAPEVYNAMPMYLKLEDAIYTKKKQQNDLDTLYDKINLEIKKAASAKVIIRGTAYTGTTVKINNQTWRANDHYGVTLQQGPEEIQVLLNSGR